MSMNVDWVRNTLLTVQKVYKPILDEVSDIAFINALAGLKVSYDRFQSGKEETWGYEIFDSAPLRFKPSPETGYNPIVDIYCDIRWNVTNGSPVKQEIKMRIWCSADTLGYREEFDSLEVCDKLTSLRSHPGRVISRFHFDRVNHDQNRSNQYHPRYHVQVGGNAPDYELCWFPKGFKLPRISYHPMELFLTCQLVAANFFTASYADIREKGEWQTYLWKIQETMLSEYYAKCLKILGGKKVSLLDALEENGFDHPSH